MDPQARSQRGTPGLAAHLVRTCGKALQLCPGPPRPHAATEKPPERAQALSLLVCPAAVPRRCPGPRAPGPGGRGVRTPSTPLDAQCPSWTTSQPSPRTPRHRRQSPNVDGVARQPQGCGGGGRGASEPGAGGGGVCSPQPRWAPHEPQRLPEAWPARRCSAARTGPAPGHLTGVGARSACRPPVKPQRSPLYRASLIRVTGAVSRALRKTAFALLQKGTGKCSPQRSDQHVSSLFPSPLYSCCK